MLFCSKHYIICNILCITCSLCVRQCAEGGQGNTFLAPMYLKCSRFMFSILAFCIKLSVPNNSSLYLDVHIHLNRSYINGFSSVQLLSHVQLFVTSWTAARQASLPITNSCNLLKLMSMESVIPSLHLICSVVPFSSCLQSFLASGSFQMNQFFISGGQSIGVSTSASVLLEFQLQHQSWKWLGNVEMPYL